jgi:hypothetical protein
MSDMTAARRLGWYWHRLRAMGPGEIAGRVLATARLSTYRSAAGILDDFHLGGPADSCPLLPQRMKAPDDVCEAVRREATSIRAGRWVLFGWKEVQIPNPPIWHRDFANDSEAPVGIPARRLNYRQMAGGTDARCIWETNRWAELVKLAQNAWLNGVLDDARLAQHWLLDWCDANPLGVGINWSSPLEAGIRLVNFCWIDALVRGCGDADLTPVQDELARRIVPSHAWWLWRNRSFGSSANNHLLGELCGLILATRRWPSLTTITCSAEVARQLMSTEVLRQFAEDGGNREQALHYHQFAWEMAWQAQRAMEDAPGPVNDRLRTAATFFCDLVHDREPWDFGDSDDAQITPLASERRTAVIEWKAWLLGSKQGTALRFWLGDPPPDVPALRAGTWRAYPVTGLAVQEVNGWKVRVDGSPLGFGTMAAHGHLDAMHVSLWDGEHALVIDPGTGAYFGNPEVRTKLASWELHNGPLPLAGRANPHRMGPFLWANHHSAPQLTLESETCRVRFASADSLINRTIRYVADVDAWRVTDEIAEEQSYVVRWRLSPQWHVVSSPATEITVAHTEGERVKLSVESDGLIGLDVSDDLVSQHFGDLGRGVVISVSFRKRLVSQWQRVTADGHI